MADDEGLRHRYQVLRMLLKRNSTALQLLADLEADLDLVEPFDLRFRRRMRRLGGETLLMAEELNLLTRNKHRALYGVLRSIAEDIDDTCTASERAAHGELAVNLNDDRADEEAIVGGKAAGIARLRRWVPELVPDGFVVTTQAYRRFIEANDLTDHIAALVGDIDVAMDRSLVAGRAADVRQLILDADCPAQVREHIETRAASLAARATTWAVRSSARSEDSRWSFAGQFDTLLHVAGADLGQAYQAVVAGRFTERAVLYRQYCGFREVETPMAVLFMPMVDAQAAGVLYTRDPQEPGADRMVVTMVRGTSDELLRGQIAGDTAHISRDGAPQVLPADAEGVGPVPDYLPRAVLDKLVGVALDLTGRLGHELDIEWAADRHGHLWLLQARPLRLVLPAKRRRARGNATPIIDGGTTVVPGRAQGPVEHLTGDGQAVLQTRGPVVVLDQATPDVAAILPKVAALLVKEGNPAGHAAALIREFSVPTIFRLGDAVSAVRDATTVSVNASRHRVYRDTRWEGIRQRTLARIDAGAVRRAQGPLHELVTSLNLTDPNTSTFRPRSCRSIHDVIRFVHEMSIRSMFDFGDRQNRFWSRSTRKLKSLLAFDVRLIDVGDTLPGGKKAVGPEDVRSVPFQAFWRGAADARVGWDRKHIAELDWLPSGFVDAIMSDPGGARRKGTPNYVVVAPDYLNLNARVTYHYAMIDAVVGPGKERNHVHYRSRGGGADALRRARRARFLESVLRHSRFVVDRKGDLVTAWLRGYPSDESEHALEILGRLLACARQLDLLLTHDRSVRRSVDAFLADDYGAFQSSL